MHTEDQGRNLGVGNPRYSQSLCPLYGRELRQDEAVLFYLSSVFIPDAYEQTSSVADAENLTNENTNISTPVVHV